MESRRRHFHRMVRGIRNEIRYANAISDVITTTTTTTTITTIIIIIICKAGEGECQAHGPWSLLLLLLLLLMLLPRPHQIIVVVLGIARIREVTPPHTDRGAPSRHNLPLDCAVNQRKTGRRAEGTWWRSIHGV
jgi:hypothetical protein